MRHTESYLTLAAAFLALGSARADLVAHFKFDEVGGALAMDSTGTYYGTLEGSAKFVGGGISGNAVQVAIAGNGLVNFGDVYSFVGRDFTISLWAKTAPEDQTEYLVASRHVAGYPNGYFLCVNGTAGGAYGAKDKGMFYVSAAPGQEVTSTSSVNDGGWHQIVGVYHAGGRMSIFVDGAPLEDEGDAIAMRDDGPPFIVGGVLLSGVRTATFNGQVDDLQFYDEALNCQEVQFLYENPGKTVEDFCPADCNHDGKLNINDFICFQGHFARRDVQADCDCNGSYNVNDFICFQRSFAGGCK